MFLVGGLNQIAPFLPEEMATLVMGLLTVLATYFKLNPSQKY